MLIPFSSLEPILLDMMKLIYDQSGSWPLVLKKNMNKVLYCTHNI
jgi:hypothetical protein